MKKIRISAVSYTNTKPFVYGLQQSPVIEKIELSLDNPSDCARKLINGTADIGLVPVAILPDLPNCFIISDYCIGAVQAVNSVFIFSHVPAAQIRRLRLDNESRTSNQLAKVLFKNYWQNVPEFVTEGHADGFIQIGDRTFGKKEDYPYAYDLAEEWIKFTGLPFVFAVWAANKPVSARFIGEFNSALAFGLANRSKVIGTLSKTGNFDLHDYLMNRIDYTFNDAKKTALQRFLNFVENL